MEEKTQAMIPCNLFLKKKNLQNIPCFESTESKFLMPFKLQIELNLKFRV